MTTSYDEEKLRQLTADMGHRVIRLNSLNDDLKSAIQSLGPDGWSGKTKGFMEEQFTKMDQDISDLGHKTQSVLKQVDQGRQDMFDLENKLTQTWI
ncbi:MAG: hypothetical protein HOQ24_05955 [Mycobacteriaceae bacterium]|nr:hypothetical protein [Mycobacteriaceae bacterium]